MKNNKVVQYLLKRYLLQHPELQRLKRYQRLAKLPWLKSYLEAIKPIVLPDVVDEALPLPTEPATNSIAPPGLVAFPSAYPQYKCITGFPLNCTHAYQTTQVETSTAICPTCGFQAPLPSATVIIGDKGHYRVDQCQGQRNFGRQYLVTLIGVDTPLTLREYVLPEHYFTTREQQQRRDGFFNQVGLHLADGRSQDLRVMVPWEVIAPANENRVYLLLPAEDQAPSLNDILVRRSAFTDKEVQQVLRQVLQTLVGLHQQKYTLAPGRVQTGIVHGNITLSSLLWVERGSEWFIYLTDFASWEDAFNPAVIETPYHFPQEDLTALGFVAFQLLAGTLTATDGAPLNPKLVHHWPAVYPPLKHFIFQLLGIEAPFSSAEAAYRALSQLPPCPLENQLAPPSEVVRPPRPPWWRYAPPFIVCLGLLVFGGRLLQSVLKLHPLEAQSPPNPCCFEAVGALPEGTFTYTATVGDVWEELLNLNNYSTTDILPLMEELSKDQPKMQLIYQPSASIEAAMELVQTRQVDFAILPLLEPLPLDMKADIIAYDGLALVVAFNYKGRQQGLPERLRGRLSLDVIKALYQGNIESWDQVNHSLDLPLKLYANSSPTTQSAIQHLIIQANSTPRAVTTTLETIPMLRSIIRDFEIAGIGSIGIAPLSSIEGQCSVYPLGIQNANHTTQQPFQHISGKVLKPNIDLCRTKGLYQIQPDLLRKEIYPLTYPIVIIYPYDNRLPPIGQKVAELLRSQEGQSYLQQVDLTGLMTSTPSPH